MRALFYVVCVLLSSTAAPALAGNIKVGAKAFTEGYLLAELAAQEFADVPGVTVQRKFGLGNTGVVLQALLSGDIDLCPDYTGTLAESLLHDAQVPDDATLRRQLAARNLVLSEPLGFENTYALAVTAAFAEANHVRTLSQLARLPVRPRAAFSHEFASRQDGLASLTRTYGMRWGQDLESVEHTLAYRAIAAGKVSLIDVYATDAKLAGLGLVVLEDDRHAFRRYEAVYLARADLPQREPEAWAALERRGHTIDQAAMRRLNHEVDENHHRVGEVIAAYRGTDVPDAAVAGLLGELRRRTLEHLTLVGVAVGIAVVLGIPMGVLAARSAGVGRALMLATSIVQTIPSLALLCLLIPVLGIGTAPALVALTLYSLLPVLSGTSIGLQGIEPSLLETARALGLGRWRTLWSIEIPLASQNILGGVRTATITGIGTATLAALIGAGGYGAPIVGGLALNDATMVLTGAVPSALLALLTHGVFEAVGWVLVPRALRRSPSA